MKKAVLVDNAISFFCNDFVTNASNKKRKCNDTEIVSTPTKQKPTDLTEIVTPEIKPKVESSSINAGKETIDLTAFKEMLGKTVSANKEADTKGKLQLFIGRTNIVGTKKNQQKFAVAVDLVTCDNMRTVWCYDAKVMVSLYKAFAKLSENDVTVALSKTRWYERRDHPNSNEVRCYTSTKTGASFKKYVNICSVTVSGNLSKAQQFFNSLKNQIVRIHKLDNFLEMYIACSELMGNSKNYSSILRNNFEQGNDFYKLKGLIVKAGFDINVADYVLDETVERNIKPDLFGPDSAQETFSGFGH